MSMFVLIDSYNGIEENLGVFDNPDDLIDFAEKFKKETLGECELHVLEIEDR